MKKLICLLMAVLIMGATSFAQTTTPAKASNKKSGAAAKKKHQQQLKLKKTAHPISDTKKTNRLQSRPARLKKMAPLICAIKRIKTLPRKNRSRIHCPVNTAVTTWQYLPVYTFTQYF